MKPLTFDRAFPKSLLDATEEHLMDVWRGDVRRVYSCAAAAPGCRWLDDPIRQAETAAAGIMRESGYPGYNIPRLAADFGETSVAAYWGGRVSQSDGGGTAIEPVVHNVGEADALRPPDPANGGDAALAAKLYRDVCGILMTEPYDRLWTTTIDLRSPLDTAAMLWEPSDFMGAMSEHPAVVHRFLDRVTDHLIAVVEASLASAKGRVCGGIQPEIWLPSDLGIVITDERMAMVSGDVYKEFGIPYLERISRRFGGLFIRCRGAFGRQLASLRDSGVNLLGLEYSHPYTRLADIFRVFEDSIVIAPRMGAKASEEYEGKAAFLGDMARRAPREARLWFTLRSEDPDFMAQLAIAQAHITSYRL
ncbi:MAG: uroporphyrinogen decarboxylase family protein [Oscillospiraceae bacterium]|jgi:hypothetical protein|nr:uroporphyrinogen decarboxylase family protein [Oscillospiraceae bacterium]